MSKKHPSRMSVLARGALLSVTPLLAVDHKVDFAKLVDGITTKNWGKRKDEIVAALKPKLAQDANVDDIVKVIDALTGQSTEADVVAGDEPAEPPKPEATAMDDEGATKLLAAKGCSADEIAAIRGAYAPKAAMDDEEAKREAEEKAKKEQEMRDKNPAMDSAAVSALVSKSVEAAVAANSTKLRAEMAAEGRAIRDAENAVRPYVGELALAQDSAEGVYRLALETLGVKTEGVHPSAFPVILANLPKPGAHRATTTLAHDSASDDAEFLKAFPNVNRL